ncbi:M81 family metallopeptidase [Cyclobacterium jeungdonense]|nr:M81 family metallopeptidase [Cyclobacterium jeungdonense]
MGVYHESNTFLEKQTNWEDFQNGHLLYGQSLIEEYRDAYHEIGGMVEVLDKEPDLEIVPLFYAEATPGGTISGEAADRLLMEVKTSLTDAMPLDGLMVVPHGAAVSASYMDFDGHWLKMVRKMLGPNVPIIGTIDPHCNLSDAMVKAVDALIAYKTNPHVDQRNVGIEAGRLMIDTLSGKIQPTMQAVQTKVAISIEMQHTGSSPCKELYQLSSRIGSRRKILSASVVLGFPYADVPEMGTSFIVVADGDEMLARNAVNELNEYIFNNHSKFSGDKIGLDQLPDEIRKAQKPLLLLDMGDNVGGGSPGDSTFLLGMLESLTGQRSFICIYDPEAVKIIKERSSNDPFLTLSIGGKTDQLHGKPVEVSVELISLVEGRFSEKEPRHGGQVNFNMGETAIVKTKSGNTLMLTSLRTVPFSLQQLLHFHIDPFQFDIIVAKGVHAPLAAYQSVCKSIIRANTPGVTRADMINLPYQNRRKPLYPLDDLA